MPAKTTFTLPLLKSSDSNMTVNNVVDDQSAIDVSGDDNIEVLVTDPLGRRTGFDPSAGIIREEIPGSAYFVDALGDDVNARAADGSCTICFCPSAYAR